MDKRKIAVVALLVVFVVGMSLSTVSASKTVKIGKYKCKLSKKDIKKSKRANRSQKAQANTSNTGIIQLIRLKKPKLKFLSVNAPTMGEL